MTSDNSDPQASAHDGSHDAAHHAGHDGISRRGLLLALGAAGVGAVGIAALPGSAGAAAPTVTRSLTGGSHAPQALGAPLPGLTYLNIDAQAFWPSIASQRIYQDATGTQGPVNDRIWAPLTLPVGSVIRQISTSYQVQPIVEISKRTMFSGTPATAPVPVFGQQLPMSPGGPFAFTVNLPTPVTIEAGATYTVSALLTAGSSVLGVSVGYSAPTQGFVPFNGTDPRILDTRVAGGKFSINEERVVNLGTPGARSAVFNLTVVNTEGNVGGSAPGGFVSAFSPAVAFPNNSSVNWDHAGQISANLVVAALDGAGAVKLRANVNRTDVVVDRIGFLF